MLARSWLGPFILLLGSVCMLSLQLKGDLISAGNSQSLVVAAITSAGKVREKKKESLLQTHARQIRRLAGRKAGRRREIKSRAYRRCELCTHTTS